MSSRVVASSRASSYPTSPLPLDCTWRTDSRLMASPRASLKRRVRRVEGPLTCPEGRCAQAATEGAPSAPALSAARAVRLEAPGPLLRPLTWLGSMAITGLTAARWRARRCTPRP